MWNIQCLLNESGFDDSSGVEADRRGEDGDSAGFVASSWKH